MLPCTVLPLIAAFMASPDARSCAKTGVARRTKARENSRSMGVPFLLQAKTMLGFRQVKSTCSRSVDGHWTNQSQITSDHETSYFNQWLFITMGFFNEFEICSKSRCMISVRYRFQSHTESLIPEDNFGFVDLLKPLLLPIHPVCGPFLIDQSR